MEGKGLFFPHIPDFQMSELTSINEHENSIEQTFEVSGSKASISRYAKHTLYKNCESIFMIQGNLFKMDPEHPDIPQNKFYDEDSD